LEKDIQEKQMKRLLTFFIFGFLFFRAPFFAVYAENDPNGLTVSPVFQEIAIEQKDESQDFVVAVTNNTGTRAVLKLAPYDFGGLDESGGVAFLGASSDLEKKYTLASWMRLEKDVLTLDPGETENVRVTIENSDRLSPGGHYGALTFQIGDADEAANNISVRQMFSSLVFVKKIGGEIYDLNLDGQEYKNNYVSLPNTVRLRFQNNGNTHIVPRGIITIVDPLNRAVAKGIINQESSFVLPETARVYPVKLNEIAKSFIPGRYTMTIAYRYDGKDDFTVTTLQFDFIPPMAIVIFALVIAFMRIFLSYAKTKNTSRERK
jgi:hypothetical protein